MKKYVINGFFRSGTSAIWNNMKVSNENLMAFYEPCHPHLLKLHLEESGVMNKLHQMELWKEYRNIYMDVLTTHPYISSSAYGKRVIDYISVFESEAKNMDRDLLLQSNRWHFELENFGTENYHVMHVLRAPDSVFDSMRKEYLNNDNLFVSAVKLLKMNVWNDNFWEFGELFQFVSSVYPTKYTSGSFRRLNKFKFTLDEKFVFLWTISNYLAMKQLEKIENSSLLSYEQLHSKRYSEDVFQQFGLKWNTELFRKSSKKVDLGKYNLVSKKLGLSNEFEYVITSL